jgi:hypothetical protein
MGFARMLTHLCKITHTCHTTQTHIDCVSTCLNPVNVIVHVPFGSMSVASHTTHDSQLSIAIIIPHRYKSSQFPTLSPHAEISAVD